MAQESENIARLRALNGTVLRHHQSALGRKSQAPADIEKREMALAALIETDPSAALSVAFAPDLLQSLQASFPDSASHFETHQTWVGTLRTAVEDAPDLKNAKTVNRLLTPEGEFRVYLSASQPQPMSGSITVEGMRVLGNIAARTVRPAAIASASVSNGAGTLGTQKIVTILVNLPSYKLPSAVTPDFMKGVLYGNAYASSQNTPNWSVDDFWQQNSDGQASAPFAAGQVVGPYNLTSDYNTNSTGAAFCDYLDMEQAAIAAADPAVAFPAFNRVVIVMPNNGVCSWSGISSVGYWQASSASGSFSASFHWLRADSITSRAAGVQLAAHELGHGFGLNHARSRAYPGPPAQALGAIGAAGALTEYGDPFGVMAAWNFGFYSAMHAEGVLGWLAPSNYTTVQNAGTYTISNYEARNASTLVKALRVLRDAASNSWLWIEFHTNTGNYDSQVPAQVWSGALVHYEESGTGAYTNLLDMTPASSGAFSDAALASGQTWTDPYTNLSITIGNITPTSGGSTLGVTVNYGVSGCKRANPTVTLSPSNPTVNTGGATTLTVTVKSNNGAVCPPSAYSLSAVQPSGFTGVLSATSLTLTGGASGTATLVETASSSVGTFAVSVTATDTADTADSATATSNITTAAVCAPASPVVSIAAPSGALKQGASATWTVSVKNTSSSGCSAATFTLSAVQPSGLTGRFSASALTIPPGATATATLTEAANSPGSFSVTVTAANGTYSGKAVGSLTVSASPITKIGTF
ncbi:MAG: hypothetical protein M3N93_12050 [Acidobacteriota bacterium]|nr:hypothetical protein [Acidobacteriota bacterium]